MHPDNAGHLALGRGRIRATVTMSPAAGGGSETSNLCMEQCQIGEDFHL